MSAHDYEPVWSPAAHTASEKAAQRTAPPAVEIKSPPRARRSVGTRQQRRTRLEATYDTVSPASARAALDLMKRNIPPQVLDGFSREQVAWVGRMLVKVQAEAIRTGRLSAQRSGEV